MHLRLAPPPVIQAFGLPGLSVKQAANLLLLKLMKKGIELPWRILNRQDYRNILMQGWQMPINLLKSLKDLLILSSVMQISTGIKIISSILIPN